MKIIPGLGAFALPALSGRRATAAILSFISEMIVDLENVQIQREHNVRHAEKVYRKALEKLQHPAEVNPFREFSALDWPIPSLQRRTRQV
jgi:hypothetical protein